MVVYGHTPVPEPEWLNRTINIDTGCVFGGALTAMRYPERELVSVQALHTYAEPVRPLRPDVAPARSTQHELDDVLDITDVLGKRIIHTGLHGNVIVREENAIAALEVMSRFAANPKWLIYLPPTMSPSETSTLPGYLEHPAEALAHYASVGVRTVVCQEKHMGSRAVVVVCRDEAAALRRFGSARETGVCYTRTGRPFFNDGALETAFLERVRAALTGSGFWGKFNTDWVCLDAELMPWSAKAQALLHNQYAAVGAASRAALPAVLDALKGAQARGLAVDGLLDAYAARQGMAERFTEAYRRYCWPVHSLDDYRLAPFHLLATEGAVHADKDHVWHLENLREVCAADPGWLVATPYRVVDLSRNDQRADATQWWLDLTGKGGEGMVVKPLEYVTRGSKGLVQPAVKCRGPEYLRIIYGPEYDAPANLERLRQRGLGAKRSLALREFALGLEALERFVGGVPLRQVHECVFAVLALESEPLDPRL
ncbi:MAG TPA: polynucleotide kinase-phosphatase [Cytophagales bacterium]